jgi:hypothetical protein
MKPSAEFVVYFVGVGLLGFFYGPIKAAIGSESTFLVLAVVYLLALRVAGKSVARLVARGKAK